MKIWMNINNDNTINKNTIEITILIMITLTIMLTIVKSEEPVWSTQELYMGVLNNQEYSCPIYELK